MAKDYFVLYKKDFAASGLSANKKKRELYDRIREFTSSAKAFEFAVSRLAEQPILAKKVASMEDIVAGEDTSQYVLALYFERKYQSHHYDGSSDPVPTHEVLRCRPGELESTIRKVAGEEPDKIYMGIEMNMFSGEI